jgi:hypothetical protein
VHKDTGDHFETAQNFGDPPLNTEQVREIFLEVSKDHWRPLLAAWNIAQKMSANIRHFASYFPEVLITVNYVVLIKR